MRTRDEELSEESPKHCVSIHHSHSALILSAWQIGLIVGPSGSGKSTIARAMFGDRVYRPRAVAGRSGGDRRTGRAADQGDHPPVHRRRLLLAAELDQAVQRAEQRRAVPLRPGPGAGRNDECRRMNDECTKAENPHLRFTFVIRPSSFAARRLRRVHQRGRSERGPGRVGGDCQGHPRGPDRLPLRGRHLPLRRDRVARAGLGDRHGHGHVSRGGVFGDRRSSLRSFVAGVVRGGCLRAITI